MPNQKKQQGAIATEFIIVAPFFFVLIFMIMEFSLMSVDKHFVRLAGFEAARTLITSDAPNPCDDDASMTTANRVAGFRMAAVAPSVSELFRTGGLSLKWGGIPETFGAALAKSVVHVIERLPAAMALTRISCQYDANSDTVRVEVAYWRAAKMPLIKHIIWGIYAIRQLGNDYFKIDSKYYDIHLKNPTARPIGELRGVLNHWQGTIKEAAVLVSAAGWATEESNWVDKWHDRIDTGLSAADALVQEQLAATSKVVTAVIYAVPEELRLVPIKVSVSLTRPLYDRKGADWESGQAIAVAPFTSVGEESPWYKWVRALQDLGPGW